MFIINLGCGNNYLESDSKDTYINVDRNNLVKCDVVVDLENDIFPWKDNSIDKIIAEMIVEHIQKRTRFMNECWRVLKSGSTMFITTPPAGSVSFWKDPEHVSGWIHQTFRYFCDWNTCAADQRKTWKMVHCFTKLKGDENEFIECILQKP